MFETLLHYSANTEEQRCVFDLQEIYDTEFSYNKT